MKMIKVKTKINKLLSTYQGKRLDKIAKLSKDLDISQRLVYYLLKGEKKANIHLVNAIDALLTDKGLWLPPDI